MRILGRRAGSSYHSSTSKLAIGHFEYAEVQELINLLLSITYHCTGIYRESGNE